VELTVVNVVELSRGSATDAQCVKITIFAASAKRLDVIRSTLSSVLVEPWYITVSTKILFKNNVDYFSYSQIVFLL